MSPIYFNVICAMQIMSSSAFLRVFKMSFKTFLAFNFMIK